MPESLNLKGVHAFSNKEYDLAIRYFEECLEVEGKMANVYGNLGVAYLMRINEHPEYLDRALVCLEAAEKQGHYDAAMVLGFVYDPYTKKYAIPKAKKSEENSICHYNIALELGRNDIKRDFGIVLNNLGYIFYKKGSKNRFLLACMFKLAHSYCPDHNTLGANCEYFKEVLSKQEEVRYSKVSSYEDIGSMIYDESILYVYFPNPSLREDDNNIHAMRVDNGSTPNESATNNELSDNNTLDRSDSSVDSFAELDLLIGLEEIKTDVRKLVNLVSMQQTRRERGYKTIPMSLHLVFTGNPGTGKTTVARILAQIYSNLGILSKGQLVEVDRSGLVAGYIGQTAIKTQKKIDEALGGILFIDEAYTLIKEGNDYGQEAIDTILKAMEDHRDDFIVIVAGYHDLMTGFINSNPGLKSRFNKYIDFPDYSVEELEKIFITMCSEYDFELTEGAKEILRDKIVQMERDKGVNFANARDVRNMFERVITQQASRLSEDIDADMLTITAEDFS